MNLPLLELQERSNSKTGCRSVAGWWVRHFMISSLTPKERLLIHPTTSPQIIRAEPAHFIAPVGIIYAEPTPPFIVIRNIGSVLTTAYVLYWQKSLCIYNIYVLLAQMKIRVHSAFNTCREIFEEYCCSKFPDLPPTVQILVLEDQFPKCWIGKKINFSVRISINLSHLKTITPRTGFVLPYIV